MTTLVIDFYNTPYLLAERSNVLQRMLCRIGLHSYSRWQRVPGIATQGRRKIEVIIQYQECVRPGCGYTKKEIL